MLHFDALQSLLGESSESLNSVIYLNSINSASPTACCQVYCNDIRLICSISGDVDPLVAFSFLQTFIDVLNDYLGNVTTATVKDNFHVVYQLLEEMLDAGGLPLTTSLSALRDIILPPSLLSKIFSAAGASVNSSINSALGFGSGPFSYPVPWRKTGLRYASNEIYFDLVEGFQALINKHGMILRNHVWGKIEANARLSGVPDCLLTFVNPKILHNCGFHPCVRLKHWKQNKTLSFVPPDRHFILAEYCFVTSPVGSSSAPMLPVLKDISIPFALKSSLNLEAYGANFHLTLTSRLTTRAMQNVVCEVCLGDGISNVACVTTRGGISDRYGRNLDTDAAGASWTFDLLKATLLWKIPIAPPSSIWHLRGSFNTLVHGPRLSRALQIHFEISSHTFSGLKVEQLQVMGETYKTYKGVRARSVGSVEWRW